MKGTKLWQATGSPIIQGRSRRQRPSWQQWVPAWLVSAGGVIAFLVLVPTVSAGLPWPAASAALGAFAGAIIGVEMARAMGWRFPPVWGVAVGCGGAVALIVLGAMVL